MPGSQLLFLATDTIWMTGSFKKTQTDAVEIGQRVEFSGSINPMQGMPAY